MVSRHLVLAGDSIFDNDSYVQGEPGVIEQLRKALPATCSASKIAVDGDCIKHVADQLAGLPSNATDLIVSVGGNDARFHGSLLSQVTSPRDLETLLLSPIASFSADYQHMLDTVIATGLRVHVCTIYTDIPFDDPIWRQYAPLAIKAFNEVITTLADSKNIPVLHLEKLCTEPGDFSTVSPIEPSNQGGQKIVDHLVERVVL